MGFPLHTTVPAGCKPRTYSVPTHLHTWAAHCQPDKDQAQCRLDRFQAWARTRQARLTALACLAHHASAGPLRHVGLFSSTGPITPRSHALVQTVLVRHLCKRSGGGAHSSFRTGAQGQQQEQQQEEQHVTKYVWTYMHVFSARSPGPAVCLCMFLLPGPLGIMPDSRPQRLFKETLVVAKACVQQKSRLEVTCFDLGLSEWIPIDRAMRPAIGPITRSYQLLPRLAGQAGVAGRGRPGPACTFPTAVHLQREAASQPSSSPSPAAVVWPFFCSPSHLPPPAAAHGKQPHSGGSLVDIKSASQSSQETHPTHPPWNELNKLPRATGTRSSI